MKPPFSSALEVPGVFTAKAGSHKLFGHTSYAGAQSNKRPTAKMGGVQTSISSIRRQAAIDAILDARRPLIIRRNFLGRWRELPEGYASSRILDRRMRRILSVYPTAKVYPTVPGIGFPSSPPLVTIPSEISPEGVEQILTNHSPPEPGRIFDSRFVCLVFGRPNLDIAKNSIIPDIRYFDARSREYVHFFLIGLSEDGRSFDEVKFVKSVETFESRTSWEYSEETDVMILNARYDMMARRFRLDFRAVMLFYLEAACKEGVIQSVPNFFGQIIRKAKEARGKLSASGFSDRAGIEIIKEALKEILVSCLPAALQSKARKGFYYAIRDVSKDGPWLDRNFPR